MKMTTDVQDQLQPPGLRRPSVLAWMRLARIFQKIDRASADHLRCRGLSVAQFDVLARVGSAEGTTQQQLADSLLVTKGNVCQLLDRMARAGLIVRRQEGRANRLFLTEEGRRLFHQLVPAQEKLVAGRLSCLTPAEQTELLRLLRKLDHALDDRARPRPTTNDQ